MLDELASTKLESIQIINTQRGKRKLLLDGYIYRLDRANDRGVEQWRCSKKSCRGRIHLHRTLIYSSTTKHSHVTIISSHSHPAESGQCQAAIFNDQSTTDMINRFSKSRTEQISTNNETQLIHRCISDPSISSQQIELNSSQILIFTDDSELLFRQRLANSSIWLCTTLNEIKNEYVQSIFIVQVFDNDQETFLPLIYAFLPSNHNESYSKLFNEIFAFETPKYILTNLDTLLIQSLTNFFNQRSSPPEIKISSVFLHDELCKFFQNEKRVLQDEEQKFLKYLLALAYLPTTDVIIGFETLQEICPISIENIYDRFEDLCIGRLRPNGHRAQPLYPVDQWNWMETFSSIENLLIMNTKIKQWDEMFRTSLLASSHRNLSKILRTIQQLHQHQVNTKHRNQQTNRTNRILQRYCATKFHQILQSYRSINFEDYLLQLIEYLPI